MVQRNSARMTQCLVGILATLISAISFERKSCGAAPVQHRRRDVCGFGQTVAKFLQVALMV